MELVFSLGALRLRLHGCGIFLDESQDGIRIFLDETYTYHHYSRRVTNFTTCESLVPQVYSWCRLHRSNYPAWVVLREWVMDPVPRVGADPDLCSA